LKRIGKKKMLSKELLDKMAKVKERLENRSVKIMGGLEVISIPVPNDVILCDFCNTQITEFSVPIYLGNALCPKCFKELKGDQKERRGINV